MYINEIVPETPVTIRLVRKDQKYYDLQTTVVSLNQKHVEKLKETFGDNFIVTKPIVQLTKVDISDCDIHFIGTKNNTSYIWTDNISIQMIKIGENPFHVFICNQNISNKGLRRSFRQQICVSGVIYLPDNTTDYVMLRDISLNGIGLSAAKNINIKVNDEVTLFFKDEECGANFTMKLIVVRIKDSNDNRITIGCKYKERQDYALSKYITEKQRAGLRRKRK